MPSRIPQRTEGQIWIDKNSPNRLKYYVNDHEYTVEVSGNYPSIDGDEGGSVYICGTVVKLNKYGRIAKACFPDDITDVIGVLGKTITVPAGASLEIPVTKNGWVTLFRSKDDLTTEPVETINELDLLFVDYSSWKNKTAAELQGAPVYWSMDPNNPGRLTLTTPSGFYWGRETGISSAQNVSYDNLPQIGNISKVVISETETVPENRITSIELHINFSKFDSSLEWTWPAFEKYTDGSVEKLAGNLNCSNATDYKGILEIRHGFDFSKFGKNVPKCTYSVTGQEIQGSSISDTANQIAAEFIEDNGTCRVIVSNPYNMHYTVSGRINFRLDRKKSS